MRQPTVLGWKAPGFDDEDPTLTYRVWYRLYRAIRVTKHAAGLHDYRCRLVGDIYCDWCGATKEGHR